MKFFEIAASSETNKVFNGIENFILGERGSMLPCFFFFCYYKFERHEKHRKSDNRKKLFIENVRVILLQKINTVFEFGNRAPFSHIEGKTISPIQFN